MNRFLINAVLSLVPNAQFVSNNERYVDGTKTVMNPLNWTQKDSQKGKYKVYFSPEDNVINILLSNLDKALDAPKQSFVYVSTNFITHYKLASKIKERAPAQYLTED